MVCLVTEACKGGLVGQGLLSFQHCQFHRGYKNGATVFFKFETFADFLQRVKNAIFHDTREHLINWQYTLFCQSAQVTPFFTICVVKILLTFLKGFNKVMTTA